MTLAAVIYAIDLGRMVDFYRTLGLEVDELEHGDYAVLLGPAIELSIVQMPERLAAQIDTSNPAEARSDVRLKLAFTVSSIDETVEAARLLGGPIKDDSKRWQFRGHDVQDAIDPEGNVYQLRAPL